MNNNNFQEISEVSKRHEAVRAAFETLDIYSDKDFFSDRPRWQIDEVTEKVKAALTAVQELCIYYEGGGTLKREEMDDYMTIALDLGKKLREVDSSTVVWEWQEICFEIFKRIHDMKSELGLFGEASTPPHEIDEKGEERIKSLERRGAQGGEASARQQARVIDREGIKAMFMQDSMSQRKAEAFVSNLEKLATNGEKDKAFAMCAAIMHKQLLHTALLPMFQAWAKLWRDLMPLIGAVAKGYENQREKLLKEAKK